MQGILQNVKNTLKYDIYISTSKCNISLLETNNIGLQS